MRQRRVSDSAGLVRSRNGSAADCAAALPPSLPKTADSADLPHTADFLSRCRRSDRCLQADAHCSAACSGCLCRKGPAVCSRAAEKQCSAAEKPHTADFLSCCRRSDKCLQAAVHSGAPARAAVLCCAPPLHGGCCPALPASAAQPAAPSAARTFCSCFSFSRNRCKNSYEPPKERRRRKSPPSGVVKAG